jgi:hypothetical protein
MLMRPYLRTLPGRAAWALGCAFLWFAAIQAGILILMEHGQPELRDPEYGYHLVQLRALLAEHPDRRLLLALGSSRTIMGVRPEAITRSWQPPAETPVVFNFGMCDAGPLLELCCLQRLLAGGIRPDALILEILAPRLDQERGYVEEFALPSRMCAADWPRMWPYYERPRGPFRHWCEDQLVPCYEYRAGIVSRYAPTWLPRTMRKDTWLRHASPTGWYNPIECVTTEEQRRGFLEAKKLFGPALEQFQISSVPDQALRELLRLCRQHRLPTVLVLMPESTGFQELYPTAAHGEIDSYLNGLSQEYQIPLVDARTWVPDDCYFDGHHIFGGQAERFSRRLGQEVLQPLMRGCTIPVAR